jgi:putative intracellular protease/amidase
MFDLTDSAVSHALILEFNKHAKILSAVCHGPSAFVTVKDPATQEFLIAGQRVTGFSDSEEEAVGLTAAVPFSLEQALKKAGAVYEKESDWKEKVVVAMDGRLVTGQNPASASGVARAVRDAVFGELTTRDEVK